MDIIAEKEAAKMAEIKEKNKNSTPEAIAKEKLRQLKIEEASNNRLLKDMMGNSVLSRPVLSHGLISSCIDRWIDSFSV